MSNQIMTPKEIEITKEVVAAAMLVGEWFANRDAKEWMLCDLASRSWTEQLRAEVKRLTAELESYQNSAVAKELIAARQELSQLRSQQAAVPAVPNYIHCQEAAARYGIDYNKFCAAHNEVLSRLAPAPQPSQQAGEAEDKSDCHGPDWTERDGEYLK